MSLRALKEKIFSALPQSYLWFRAVCRAVRISDMSQSPMPEKAASYPLPTTDEPAAAKSPTKPWRMAALQQPNSVESPSTS